MKRQAWDEQTEVMDRQALRNLRTEIEDKENLTGVRRLIFCIRARSIFKEFKDAADANDFEGVTKIQKEIKL